MIDRVRRFIEKEKLFAPGATVIVGLSGGMDSMVLLDLLTLSGYQCVAAHCNFHLRGEESNRDAAFVKKWCKGIDIPFTSIDFDTTQYAADKKISIEMAARELRYDWFEIVRRQYVAEAVAVAHHKDDSVETVLLNLIRGTGIKGLSGIMPKNRHVVRPLLCVTRAEIEEYIAERDMPYVFDSTNDNDIFLRNSLRLNIIPQLEKLNPSVREAIWRTSRNLFEAEKVYSESLRDIIKDLFRDDKIDIAKLRQTASPRSVLFEILSPLGFGASVIEDVYLGMESTSGKVFHSKSYRLIKDRGVFILDPVTGNERDGELIQIHLETEEVTGSLHLLIRKEEMPLSIEKNSRILYADLSKLKFPLTVRRWNKGDWFIPFGMKGRKKVSDYFTDRKYSLKEKENAWILLSGDDIVWIVGERPDDRYKITEESSDVFVVEMVNNAI
ncbi:tRNA(Ile)-lysidine synthase [Proteiniphilum saccharofermentans]|uniref:tRNA(Ile)-lysidine synthase n=1 Tax=Proteiniphilum saccharofermentans TaxID=1642647 RepID=A0A1R3SYU4_9BACT|nr:tRNA lysidine(34) synthetase TilS [Proteiniphilum saccharofermentans]SCD20671.1 tRNA(Ile)-lysidine synthase [Proteiniphilum saccharofermentans]